MKIPPRPDVIPEQLKTAARDQLDGAPVRYNYPQTLLLIAALATNLEQLLNDDQRVPWIREVTVDKREHGVSIHVELWEPSERTDVVVE